METQRPRIVSVTEIHYGFTTRYVVAYANGTQATFYHCTADFLPFLAASA